MIVLAREVFLCKCSTEVLPEGRPTARRVPSTQVRTSAPNDAPGDLCFVRGTAEHLPLLDSVHHSPTHLAELRQRLARGESWLLGLQGSRAATYTWLHTRATCEYPYLPGCAFELPADHGFGYDAWTSPEARGSGLRRRAFVEELRWLDEVGKRWESSFFVAHQLAGAQRSLARVGVKIIPLWRVALGRDRRITLERLCNEEEPGLRPCAE
jgi:hypothetical protein